MIETNLYTNDGHFVATVQTPPWVRPPELLVWGERFFILRVECGAPGVPDSEVERYTEAAGSFFIPPPIQPEEPNAG